MGVKDVKNIGLGVFATQDYQAGDIIENCHIIILSELDKNIIDKTYLYNYYYDWDNNRAVIALGNGSLYNHSYTPNAKYIKLFDKNLISFVAIKDIDTDEEIRTNYNGDPKCMEPLWFKVDA